MALQDLLEKNPRDHVAHCRHFLAFCDSLPLTQWPKASVSQCHLSQGSSRMQPTQPSCRRRGGNPNLWMSQPTTRNPKREYFRESPSQTRTLTMYFFASGLRIRGRVEDLQTVRAERSLQLLPRQLRVRCVNLSQFVISVDCERWNVRLPCALFCLVLLSGVES